MNKNANNPVARVQAFLDAHASQADCISFDVFDTLVRRRIAPPAQVKVPAARDLVAILNDHQIDVTVEDCLKTRQVVSQNLRQAQVDQGNDPESHLRQIIAAWLRHYLNDAVTEAQIDDVLQAEMQAERSVCYPTAGMVPLVEEMKQRGKRLIFISDMYLGFEEISQILKWCGYTGLFDAGYVSGDIGLSKKTGRLYRYALAKETMGPGHLIHVGDHPLADIRVPKGMGIRTCRFHDPIHEKWEIRHRRLKKLGRVACLWEGARWVEMDPPDSKAAQVAKFDDAYATGLHILGPLLTNFVHQVIERVAEDGSEVVLFPAREGFILLSIYNQLAEHLAIRSLPPGEYVCLSRQSTFLASVSSVGEREIVRGLHTRPTLRKLLNKLNLAADQFESLAADCGIGDLDEMVDHPLKDERLRRFFSANEFEEILTSERESCRKLLYDYLRQFGFWAARRAALVDVGWTGTIQESLALAFHQRPDWPHLNGYYIGLLDRSKAKAHESAKSKFHGIFYDYRHTRHRTGINRFTELFENAARAPHPTTMGYRRSVDGRVLPVLGSADSVFYVAEQKNRHLLASLQAGILDYAERYARTIPFRERSPAADGTFLASLVDRLIRYPTRSEAAVLRKLAYSNEFGGLVFIPGKVATDVDARQTDFQHTLPKGKVFNHMWREGVYADSSLPGLNALFNLYRSLVKRHF